MTTVRKESKSGAGGGPWVTYPRCFVLTLGILFAGIGGLGLRALDEAGAGERPWLYFLLGGMILLGLYEVGVGLFGTRRQAERLAASSLHHEASLVVIIVAAPLYFVLKQLGRRRR